MDSEIEYRNWNTEYGKKEPNSKFQIPNSAAKPLVAIVGQTASGKSDLAMKLAAKYGGEIIAADSRTIYKGMDIGTAKPSLEDQKAIVHYGLDLIAPDKTYSAAEFKHYAQVAINTIHGKNKLPIVVGGTGLYVDGLLYDFEFGSKVGPKLRSKFEAMSLDQLQKEAVKIGLSPDDINFKNKRHLSRAIERGGMVGKRKPLPANVLILGIAIDNETLSQRIEKRADKMLESGLAREVKGLVLKYGEDAPGLLAPSYKALIEHINGRLNMEEAKNKFIQNDKKLAKRQKTWFQRNPDIVWIKNYSEARNQVSNFLSKFDTIHA